MVDDSPVDRRLVQAFLEDRGHELTFADSGLSAIDAARAAPPDLVLLDVMLPGMNGFETARQLKALTADFLPILMLTSLHDPTSKITGLRMGADDFLSKPIDQFELNARVDNLLTLRVKEKAILKQNTELAQLHRFRDEMTAMLVHDLKNPMAVIIANLEYMSDILNDPAQMEEPLIDTRSAAARVLRMVANLLDVSRMEGERFAITRAPCPLNAQLAELVKQRTALCRVQKVSISLDASGTAEISADQDLLLRAIENIVDNALRYTPAGGRIELRSRCEAGQVEIRIGNSGPAIPLDARERIFEKYGQSGYAARMNHGLGLYFCRLVANAHEGRIWVETTEPLPTVFVITFPG